MKKQANSNVVVQIHFNNNGKDVSEILKQSVLLFIENEVKKLCNSQS